MIRLLYLPLRDLAHRRNCHNKTKMKGIDRKLGFGSNPKVPPVMYLNGR